MGDYLVKAVAFEGQVRAYSLVATDMVNEAVKRQGTWPTITKKMSK